MLNYNLKLLTCDDSVQLKNGDFKSFKYETNKRTEASIYDASKRNYCERRGGNWRASRPRQIRQLESKLRDRSVVSCQWTTESLITIIFSSGAIAYLTIKPSTLDVLQILFDRYCVNKLSAQVVTGAINCSSHLMFTHADRLATLITYGKKGSSNPCRISEKDPYLQFIELGGPRRSDRRLSSCESKGTVKVLVWSTSTVEPAPWSPVVEDHANLHLYSFNGQQMTLLAYHQMENETLSAELSQSSDCTVHTVEQIICHKNGVNLNWLQYEIPKCDDKPAKLSLLIITEIHVSLPAPARTLKRSLCNNKMLIACIDGSLHIIHNAVGITHSVRAGFIATEVHWAGDLIIAAEEGGRLQCFDQALSPLPHHTKCFDFTSYLRDPKRMQILATSKARGGVIILLLFAGGPLALLHITHPRLLTAWLRLGRSSNAVALLRAADWSEDGVECLWAVNKLVCAALRSGSEAVSEEGCAQAALGAFLAPRAPLGPAARKFAPPIHDLARKFFHHLLRRGRIEKALSLAVDLRAWDLFCDARWAASRRGLRDTADEAAALALQHAHLATESDCSDSCSQCSSQSYSDDTSASEHQRKPPPLPRVGMPTTMAVPTAHPEPTARSIRPNLHQYLDRDTTIWTTNAEDTYVKITNPNRIKPILNQNGKWIDNVSRLAASMPTLAVINENPTKLSLTDVRQKPDEKSHFRNIYQTDLRDGSSNITYRYHDSYHLSVHDRSLKSESGDRSRPVEKNKVKFSDKVTIAVVSEPPPPCPEAARELADSLPLCPPHKYLAAFAPHPRTHLPQHLSQLQLPPGHLSQLPPSHLSQLPPSHLSQLPPSHSTQLPPSHLSQLPASHLQQPPPQHLPRTPAENGAQQPPKIKVVHFGMV